MLAHWKFLLFLFTLSLMEICFAGTVCDDFDVRLEETTDKRSTGQTVSGCVEICYDDEYRGLCNPEFDETEAAVVCQQLGFPTVLSYGECPLSGYELGTGVPFPHRIDCAGTESDLSECSLSTFTIPCEYTTITCTQSVYFQLTRRQYSTSEFENIEICVELAIGETVEELTLILQSHYYTATVGLDYEALYHYMNFSANSAVGEQRCATVTIIDDILVEFPEHFTISATGIDGPTQDVEFLPWRDYADVIIVDDDIVEIGFAEDSYTVDEDHEHVLVCAEIVSLEASELQRAIWFRVSTSDGSATGGSDFGYTTQLVAFHIGDGLDDLRCADISIVDDSVLEDEETFSVELFVSDLGVLVAEERDTTTVYIVDDDGFVIHFINNTPDVTAGNVTINFAGNLPIQSAHCLIELHSSKDDLWEDCSSQSAFFLIEQQTGRRRYPIYVNATSIFGQVAYLARDVRRENRWCSAHFINDGVTVDGNNVTVEWQGTGPNVEGGNRVSQFRCTLPGQSPTPCSSPYEFISTYGVGTFELEIQAFDLNNECVLRDALILIVEFEIEEQY